MSTEVITTLSYEELKSLIAETVNDCLRFQEEKNKKIQEKENCETDNGRLISKKTAARLLECSPGTVDNAARAGRLKRHYVGRSVRFDRAEVIALATRR